MPRYRKLYTKTTESLDINDMPDDFTRLMWVLLPLAVCREGRGIDHAAWLKSKLFPLRDSSDVTPEKICAAMSWYAERGMILRYTVDGRPYFQVVTFKTHQGDTSRESASNYPPPPESLTTNSRLTQDELTTNSCLDAYAHVDANADTQTHSEAPESGNGRNLTPAIAEYERLYGMLINQHQLTVLLDAEEEVGSETVIAAINWANDHTPRIKSLSAIVTAAKNWQGDTGPPANAPPAEPQLYTVDLDATPKWMTG